MYRVIFKADCSSFMNMPTETRTLRSYTEVNNFRLYCYHKYGCGSFKVSELR